MSTFEHTLLLLLAIASLSLLGKYIPLPRPIVYVLGGVALAYAPGFPDIAFEPDSFFLCFLPPLLFSDGWLMPLRELWRVRRSVLFLATGLVVLTTVVVGFAAHALIPGLPLPLAFALGAVISPTDAVAIDAVTEKLKLPTRLSIVLKGESLLNDATGLVGFKFAVAALAAGAFSVQSAVVEFGLIAAGGLIVGLAVAYVIGRVRDFLQATHGDEPHIEATLSLLTPFAAYLLGESVSVSGILAIVAAGLYSGWRDPVRMSPDTRQLTWSVWSTLLFWLNGFAFVLLGLQFPGVLAAVSQQHALPQLAGYALGVSGIAIALRLAWFVPGALLPFACSEKVRCNEERPTWPTVLIGGWAGVRGAVTLAAALSLPTTLPDGSPFPARDLVIFLAFGVIVTTLLLQGATLPWLIARVGLQGDGLMEREEHLARTTAVAEGLRALRAAEPEAGSTEQAAALGHVAAEYEQRLAELAEEGPKRTNAREQRDQERRYRLLALRAERHALDQLWRDRQITDDVHRPLQHLLDHEERLLRGSERRH